MIHARSTKDIRVVNSRYAIVLDVNKNYRVVSLVRTPFRELAARYTSMGMSYVFDREGRGPFYKQSYNQPELEVLYTTRGLAATESQLAGLVGGAVRVDSYHTPAAALVKGALEGMPYNNHQLDPQRGGWVIATVTENGLLFGSKPKVHRDQGAAEAELQRLATVSPGTEFVLLKATKTAITQTVQTKTFA